MNNVFYLAASGGVAGELVCLPLMVKLFLVYNGMMMDGLFLAGFVVFSVDTMDCGNRKTEISSLPKGMQAGRCHRAHYGRRVVP